MDKFDANRRKLLALGGVALGAAILPTPAFATLSTPRPRILTLNNLHTGESIKAEFFDGRGYIQEELAKLNHFFRDYRANKIKSNGFLVAQDNRPGDRNGAFAADAV